MNYFTVQFLTGKVIEHSFKAGEPGKVELQDKTVVELTAKTSKSCLPADEQSLTSIDDMVILNDLNEPALLHNLRIRFKRDIIYTYVSSILVSVNPFKSLSLYTPDVMDEYVEGDCKKLKPHIFALADNAFRNMLDVVRGF